jgi:GDP-4-dehydro-6-deoxy-D-mannose reductase
VRAVVTGARGFVGPYLLEHLRASGDEAIGVDREDDHAIDVTDGEQVLTRWKELRPEVVYHLAALSHVGDSWSSPGVSFRVNAEGTLNVLRASVEVGVQRFVFVGSSEEYGRAPEDGSNITESAPLDPITPYGASKVAADVLARQAYLASGLETIRVRPFGHTGPGQSPSFMVPALASRIAHAERDGIDEIPVGTLTAVRDLSDVRDVVRAYRLLAERGRAGEAYNVCRGEGVSVQQVAETLIGAAARPIRLVTDPALVRPVDAPRLVGDNTKLRSETGWQPEIPLTETLSDVLAAARAAVAVAG